MKVTMTNADVQALIRCLETMKEKNAELPVKVWYTLSWNRGQLNISAKAAEEVRLQLVKKHGEVGDGGITSVPSDNMPAFQKEYLELLDAETEVTIRRVSIEALSSASEVMNGIEGIFDFFNYMVEDPEKTETKALNVETVEA
jgi:hypothetical protein